MKNVYTLLLVCLTAFSLFGQEDRFIRVEAEQMPYFPGCDNYENHSDDKRKCSNLALVTFIAQNIEYPESAKQSGLEGTVYVGFVVDAEGKVGQIEVLRDIGEGCGEAALAVLRNMPSWEPAHHDGEAVAVKLNIPIQFFMKEEESDQDDSYKINWGLLTNKEVSKNDLLANLNKKVVVRDPFGNAIPVSNLRFSFERKRKFYEAQSTGSITKDMKKVAKKAKKGGVFVLTATLQEEGKFRDIIRVFSIK